jgi:hypothetical protein
MVFVGLNVLVFGLVLLPGAAEAVEDAPGSTGMPPV